jgi:hypothetical protein
MANRIRFNSEMLSFYLVVALGLYGLWVCVPGFRPKELRDFVLALSTQRGLGAFANFAIMTALAPLTVRLRSKGFTKTFLGSLIMLLAVLLSIDLLTAFFVPSLNVWPLRISYTALVLAGAPYLKEFGIHLKDSYQKMRSFWRALPMGWRIFGALVFFFFVRQDLHFWLTRGAPAGDEIYFWHTASHEAQFDSLRSMMNHHRYTPGLPWLASLAGRIFGVMSDEWLLAYPFMIMTSFLLLSFELSSTAKGFFAALNLSFFVFLRNRDLFHIFSALLYGEALASILAAVFFAEVYLLFFNKPRSLRLPNLNALGLGLVSGFCALSKPPISALAVPFSGLLAFWSIKSKHIKFAALLLVATFVPYFIFRFGQTYIGKSPEYTMSLKDVRERGIQFGIIWQMITTLFQMRSPNMAYTLGMCGALLVTALQKNWRLLGFMLVCIALYWGFVFGVYATVWQKTEQGSAGRYFSHAGVACVLLVPLAYLRGRNRTA